MLTAFRRMLALLIVPTALVVLAVPASAATVQPQPVAGASPQGIIMRDGGICDPIRWGC